MSDAHTFDDKYHVEIRDARGVVIGDNNVVYQYFLAEHYRPLAEHLITFDDLIAERTADFVGRAFLDARLATFMEQHDRGYFVLVGEPGIGKTAWAAHVVREYQALHHFNVSAMGIVRPDKALENLCAQLVARFQLDRPFLPVNAGRDGGLLDKLLHQAAERLDGSKLVIVIDALDEAQMPGNERGTNALYLPSSLPIGVYFVLTRRPQPVSLETAPGTPSEDFTLGADLPANQADVRAYLHQQATRPEIAVRLADRHILAERFVEELFERSAGNFMYLAYLLPDIAAGLFDPLNLTGLPQGLRGYYERFWNELESTKGEGREAWTKFYKPVIGMLAAAREPVSAAWIGRILDLNPDEMADFALARWNKFLHLIDVAGEVRWQLYHASFADFLAEKLDGAKRYHSRIADHYRTVCLGEWLRLLDVDQGYGLRHLAEHLAAASKWDELHRLVAEGDSKCQPWAEARHKLDGSYSGYLSDLRAAQVHVDAEVITNQAAVSHQIRYALIESSLHSLAETVTIPLLEALVRSGEWSTQVGLDHAGFFAEQEQRLEALTRIVPYLRGRQQEEAISRAFEMLTEISHDTQLKLLALLGPWAPESKLKAILQRALTVSDHAWDDPEIVEAVLALLPFFPENERNRILQETLNKTNSVRRENRLRSFVAILPHLPVDQRDSALLAALEIARQRESGWGDWACQRGTELATLAIWVPEGERLSVLTEAQHALEDTAQARPERQSPDYVDWLEWAPERWEAQDILSFRLAQLQGEHQALEVAAQIWQKLLDTVAANAIMAEGVVIDAVVDKERLTKRLIGQTGLLAKLTGCLPESERIKLLGMKRSDIRSLQDRQLAIRMLVALSDPLPGPIALPIIQEALRLTRQIDDQSARFAFIIAFAGRLPEDDRSQAFQLLLDSVRNADAQHQQRELLLMLAPHLPENFCPAAVEILNKMWDEEDRAKVLTALAPRLTLSLLEQVVKNEEATWPCFEFENEEGELEVVQVPDRTHVQVLAVLAPFLPKERRAEVMEWRLLNWQNYLLNHPSGDVPGREMQELALGLLEAGYSVRKILSEMRHFGAWESQRGELVEAISSENWDAGDDPQDAGRSLIEAAKSLPYEYKRAEVLAKMATHLPIELLPETLSVVRKLRQSDHRARVLAALAAHLPGAHSSALEQEALDALRDLVGSSAGNTTHETFERLTPCLPAASLKLALDIAREIKHSDDRARTLTALACYLPESDRSAVLRETLEFWGHYRSSDTVELMETLADLSPLFPAKMLDEAITVMVKEHIRSLDNTKIPVVYLAQTGHPHEALSLLRAIGSFEPEIVVELAPLLPNAWLQEAIEIVRRARNSNGKASALVTISRYLPTDQRALVVSEALKMVRSMFPGETRLGETLKLIPHLPTDEQAIVIGEALEVIQQLTDAQGRCYYLSALTQTWVDLPPQTVVPFWQSLIHASARRRRASCLSDLSALTHYLYIRYGKEVGLDAIEAISAVARWYE